MHIAFVEIQNFRKLKACRVEIAQRETIFVGANNSGKPPSCHCVVSPASIPLYSPCYLSSRRSHSDSVSPTLDKSLANFSTARCA